MDLLKGLFDRFNLFSGFGIIARMLFQPEERIIDLDKFITVKINEGVAFVRQVFHVVFFTEFYSRVQIAGFQICHPFLKFVNWNGYFPGRK
jgi:hypothetical protein